MEPNLHATEHRADLSNTEAETIAAIGSQMEKQFGPFTEGRRADLPSAVAALGARIEWLAARLGLDLSRDGRQLAMRAVDKADLRRRSVDDAVRFTLFALTLERVEQPNSPAVRSIQSEAQKSGLMLSSADVAYHLRQRALEALLMSSQVVQPAGGSAVVDIDAWIVASGRAVITETLVRRTESEGDVVASVRPRFEAFLRSRWTNIDPDLRDDILQEGALRLLKTERSRILESEVGHPDGYRFQVMVNRARTEFARDRARRNRTEPISDVDRGDLRLSHLDELPDHRESAVEILRAATVDGGPVEKLLALSPRNVHGPVLLAHLRSALGSDLFAEARLVAALEHDGGFGDDRTKDGSAALNRIVWAAASVRDPEGYPPDDVNTANRPMKRVRRFVEDFVLPSFTEAAA